MLTLRTDQIEALKELSWNRCAVAVERYFRTSYPARTEAIGDEAAKDIVRRAMNLCEKIGATTVDEYCRCFDCILNFGCDFSVDPRLSHLPRHFVALHDQPRATPFADLQKNLDALKRRVQGGLDHKSAQNRALNSAFGVGEVGRTSELSYPWKCKLTRGSQQCPKILPQLTLAQMPGVRHPAEPGRRAAVYGEAPHPLGAGGATRARRWPVGAGTPAAAGGSGVGGGAQYAARLARGGAVGGAARGGGGVPGDPGGGAVAASTGGGDAFDHHPAGRRRGAAGV